MKRVSWDLAGALCCVGLVVLLGIGCSDDDGGGGVDAALEAGPPEASVAICGDGFIDGDEECDDGNDDDGDGCSSECLLEYECGNGTVEFDEECDGDEFTSSCVWEGHLGGSLLCTDSCTQDATECYDTHEDIIAWYRMNTTSTLVADNAGNGHGCIAHELQPGFPGPIEESTLFEEMGGSYAECGTGDATSPFDGYTSMTVEAWVKLNSYAGIDSQMRVAVSRNQTGDASDLGYLIGVAGPPFAPNNYHAMFASRSLLPEDIAFSGNALVTGNWYHLAGVYDNGQLSLYVNGVLEGQVTQDASGPVPAVPMAQTYLGGLYLEGETAPQELFDGFIDDVKIWSVARTPEEICLDSGGFYDLAGDPPCTHPELP